MHGAELLRDHEPVCRVTRCAVRIDSERTRHAELFGVLRGHERDDDARKIRRIRHPDVVCHGRDGHFRRRDRDLTRTIRDARREVGVERKRIRELRHRIAADVVISAIVLLKTRSHRGKGEFDRPAACRIGRDLVRAHSEERRDLICDETERVGDRHLDACGDVAVSPRVLCRRDGKSAFSDGELVAALLPRDSDVVVVRGKDRIHFIAARGDISRASRQRELRAPAEEVGEALAIVRLDEPGLYVVLDEPHHTFRSHIAVGVGPLFESDFHLDAALVDGVGIAALRIKDIELGLFFGVSDIYGVSARVQDALEAVAGIKHGVLIRRLPVTERDGAFVRGEIGHAELRLDLGARVVRHIRGGLDVHQFAVGEDYLRVIAAAFCTQHRELLHAVAVHIEFQRAVVFYVDISVFVLDAVRRERRLVVVIRMAVNFPEDVPVRILLLQFIRYVRARVRVTERRGEGHLVSAMENGVRGHGFAVRPHKPDDVRRAEFILIPLGINGAQTILIGIHQHAEHSHIALVHRAVHQNDVRHVISRVASELQRDWCAPAVNRIMHIPAARGIREIPSVADRFYFCTTCRELFIGCIMLCDVVNARVIIAVIRQRQSDVVHRPACGIPIPVLAFGDRARLIDGDETGVSVREFNVFGVDRFKVDVDADIISPVRRIRHLRIFRISEVVFGRHIGVAVHRERLFDVEHPALLRRRIRHCESAFAIRRGRQFYDNALELVGSDAIESDLVFRHFILYFAAVGRIHDLRDLAVLHEDVIKLLPVRADDLHPVAGDILRPLYRHGQRPADKCPSLADGIDRVVLVGITRGIRPIVGMFIRHRRGIRWAGDIHFHISRNARLRDISRVVHRIERKAVIPRPRCACRAVILLFAVQCARCEIVHIVTRPADAGILVYVCERIIATDAAIRQGGRCPISGKLVIVKLLCHKEPHQRIFRTAHAVEDDFHVLERPHGHEAVLAHEFESRLERARHRELGHNGPVGLDAAYVDGVTLRLSRGVRQRERDACRRIAAEIQIHGAHIPRGFYVEHRISASSVVTERVCGALPHAVVPVPRRSHLCPAYRDRLQAGIIRLTLRARLIPDFLRLIALADHI